MSWELRTDLLTLGVADWSPIESLAGEILGGAEKVAVADAIEAAPSAAQEMPRWLRRRFQDFKQRQSHHLLGVAIPAFDPGRVRPTPAMYRPGGVTELVDRFDLVHLMLASLLGQPFAWASIQSGYLFNDVMPIAANRDLPLSSGSATDFGLHTEDAFQRWAGDYLGLACLRNPDRVPTIFAGFEMSELSRDAQRVLFEDRFVVGANIAHDVGRVVLPSPILFGSEADPYLRINLNATVPRDDDAEAAAALSEFTRVLRRNVTPFAFEPGQFWYIDNLRVAHGRDRFEPRYDGTDRWLRRLYISSAYRYSRGLRVGSDEAVLSPSAQGWQGR